MRLTPIWLSIVLQAAIVVAGCADAPGDSNSGGSGGTVVQQNAIYICDRPGPVELCVDASDGACVKTLCTDVTCPPDP
ncbi:MAG: hypothetical protein JRE45_12835 [Deltaproteobacteria bacterium]|nr:hypothetical protein [Deltaproteobacteria bacterium]MBW2628500.1 hypothetical protein [Deltaproteobacteria bacterium]MBW2686831.1 hypothetical protein [Deltaproteobacteria bacterium]